MIRPKRSKGRKRAKTLASLKKTAWGLLSQCVRYEAHEIGMTPCYTCSAQYYPKDMQAGHAIGGRTGMVLLDEEIIRPQCYRCNCALHGNYGVFATKLIREKGLEWWEKKLQDSRQIKKWNRQDLEEKISDYKARLSRLEGP